MTGRENSTRSSPLIRYARSAWNGTASYDDHSSAVVNGTSFLAARAFASTPAIAIQVSRVVTGVAGLHQAGLYQIQMLAASDRPLTSAEIAKLSDPRLPIQALFGPFLPLDRMHRMEQVLVEGNRFVDAGGFLTRVWPLACEGAVIMIRVSLFARLSSVAVVAALGH